MDNELVYFELNNWSPGKDYPNEEPFLTWISNDLNIYFNNETWVIENRLCVIREIIDMSTNFCITATKEWVEKNCPNLLTIHTKFLRQPDEYGDVYGQWGTEFLPYEESNFGITEKWDDD